MRLAVFDLDHTLLAGDSDDLWGEFLIELGRVDAETQRRANRRFAIKYKAGTLDIAEFYAFALQSLAGNSLADLHAWRERYLREKIEPIVAARTFALLEHHRAQGDTLLITTATNSFITTPIAELLGVPHLIATEPEFAGGGYTGRVAGLPNFQDGKVTRLRSWLAAQPHRYEHLTCYSDSRNDIPLLEMAQVAIAVDPDDTLRAHALQRGWPVISLR